MRVVAIIQARLGSTRLPGKVLADVGGRSMLGRVCDRARRAALVDQVVVATTLEPDDQQVVDECARLQVACFRGSTEDVLERYDQAARAFEADAVVRITADCPLIDPQVIDLVVGAFQEARQALQHSASLLYASNTLRRTWPRGLDVEVMTAAALAQACREAREPYQRTHVTPYIYQHPDLFRLLAVTQRVPGPEDLGHWRWTVDVPEDLDFVRAVYGRLARINHGPGETVQCATASSEAVSCVTAAHCLPCGKQWHTSVKNPGLGGGETFSWRDVQQLLAREPVLAELNRHVRQKQLVEG